MLPPAQLLAAPPWWAGGFVRSALAIDAAVLLLPPRFSADPPVNHNGGQAPQTPHYFEHIKQRPLTHEAAVKLLPWRSAVAPQTSRQEKEQLKVTASDELLHALGGSRGSVYPTGSGGMR